MSELRRRLMMREMGRGSVLPPEYQQVEWIQSSGTQWIDLNFIPAGNNNLVFDIEAEIISSGALFGGRRMSFGQNGLILNTLLNNPFLDYGNRFHFNVSFITPPRRNHFFIENHIFYIDDVNIAEIGNITPPTMTMVLFSVRDVTTVGGYVGAKMYHAYFYQPEVVNIDLYPCYRKSDNVAGMYDIINNVFYTNNGSGSFAVGPDVN